MKQAILIASMLLAACMDSNRSKTSGPVEEKLPADNQVMCTMDAMQCADGSWVGRSSPKCEFVCPATADK